MRPLLLMLLPALLVACGGTETVTVTNTMTETVTETETVTKRATPPPPRIIVPPVRPRVFVPSHDSLLYKPDTIGLGASSAITEIRWTSYGGQTAIGNGIFPSNDCDPSCAEGTSTPIEVTVRLTSRVLCRGELVYALMAIDGAGFDNSFDTVSDDTSC